MAAILGIGYIKGIIDTFISEKLSIRKVVYLEIFRFNLLQSFLIVLKIMVILIIYVEFLIFESFTIEAILAILAIIKTVRKRTVITLK